MATLRSASSFSVNSGFSSLVGVLLPLVGETSLEDMMVDGDLICDLIVTSVR